MNSYKYLLKNIGLLTASQFASKFITFFMLPLYTYYLSTQEYGVIDLVQVTESLVIPIITLSIADGVLCYCFDQSEDKTEIFSIGTYITLGAIVIAWIGCFVAGRSETLQEYWVLIGLAMTCQMLTNLVSNFARAIDKVRAIAISSTFTTFIVASVNIFLIAYMKLGVLGYFIALNCGNVVRLVYLAYQCKIWNYVRLSGLSQKTLGKLLKYSIPMIPNSLFWWVNASIDKYFVTGMMSLADAGLYSVGVKMPTVGNSIVGVFNSAWRLSAIKENNSQGKHQFFNQVFELFSLLIIGVTMGITVLAKPLAYMLFNKEFFQAWTVVPFLMVGFYFSCVSAFIGNLFLGARITKILFTTTVYGAVVNIILNLLMIPSWGIMGAAVATMISNCVVYGIRLVRAEKMLGFCPALGKQFLMIASALLTAVIVYIDIIWLYIFVVPLVILVLYTQRSTVNFVLDGVKKLFAKKGAH